MALHLEVTLLTCLALVVQGCDDVQKTTDPQQPVTTPMLAQSQRFAPIQPNATQIVGLPWHGFFALDTHTGQLCRTTDVTFPTLKADSPMNAAPLCIDLYNAKDK
jgi:hypothetical protein